MIFQQTGIFQHIDLNIAIRSKADARTGGIQAVRRNRPVAQIALRSWTRADGRTTQESRFFIRDVDGVDRSEALVEDAFVMEQFNWTASILRNAGFDFSGLLGHVHM